MKSLAIGLLAFCSVSVFAEQACDTSVYPASTPASHFEDHGDGTVTDLQSKLMWMRCSAGQTWSGTDCVGEAVDLDWRAAQAAADEVNRRGTAFYKDWRVPRIPELATITERQCETPRINLALFPHTPAGFYWTASTRPVKEAATSAFALSFGADGVRFEDKGEANLVRLVRNAQ